MDSNGSRGGADNQSDPHAAKRAELLKNGERLLRDDEQVQRDVVEFDAEMERRREAATR